jgi:hypothetical protein
MRKKTLLLVIFFFLGAASVLKAQNPSSSASGAPPVPTGLKALAKEMGILLSWDKPTQAGTQFNIYLTDGSGKIIRKLTAQPLSDDWVLLDKVKPTHTYHFVVTALNSAGVESAPTAPLEALLAELPEAESPNDSATEGGPQTVTDEGSEQKGGEGEEKEEKEPFKPNWTGNLAYTFSSEDTLGQAEINQEIALTGTYNYTESGDYFSVVAGGGQEKLEGSPTSYGTFSGEGGLTVDSFKPSLTIAFQQGAQALNSYDATLSLNFQIFKELEFGPMFEGNPESHQGPPPIKSNPDKIVEIDSVDWTGGFVATATPWDFLELSLTWEEDYSRTYLWQNILHTDQHDLNETQRIPSVTLSADMTFLTDFVLTLSIQEGIQYFPVGINFSPILKETVDFTSPATVSFSSYSFGLTYNL